MKRNGIGGVRETQSQLHIAREELSRRPSQAGHRVSITISPLWKQILQRGARRSSRPEDLRAREERTAYSQPIASPSAPHLSRTDALCTCPERHRPYPAYWGSVPPYPSLFRTPSSLDIQLIITWPPSCTRLMSVSPKGRVIMGFPGSRAKQSGGSSSLHVSLGLRPSPSGLYMLWECSGNAARPSRISRWRALASHGPMLINVSPIFCHILSSQS